LRGEMILLTITLGSILIPLEASSSFARLNKVVKISLDFAKKSRSSMVFISEWVFYERRLFGVSRN
jgi:hypothetical protein